MIGRDQLVALACGDLQEPEATAVEEHLLACDGCARAAEALQAVVREVAALAEEGRVRGVITASTLGRLRAEGIPHGEYELGPGESVFCHIAAGDRFNAVTLRADLADVERLTLVVRTPEGAVLDRVEDIPFDAREGRVVTVEAGEALRQMPTMRIELSLHATTPSGEQRLVGEYALDHRAG